jgi:hypothetical protein
MRSVVSHAATHRSVRNASGLFQPSAISFQGYGSTERTAGLLVPLILKDKPQLLLHDTARSRFPHSSQCQECFRSILSGIRPVCTSVPPYPPYPPSIIVINSRVVICINKRGGTERWFGIGSARRQLSKSAEGGFSAVVEPSLETDGVLNCTKSVKHSRTCWDWCL